MYNISPTDNTNDFSSLDYWDTFDSMLNHQFGYIRDFHILRSDNNLITHNFFRFASHNFFKILVICIHAIIIYDSA